jgi:hypothetical protein
MTATRLQQIRGWTIHPKSKFNKVVDRMIKSRTNLPVDYQVSASSEIAGGSVTHRLYDHATKRSTLHNSRANHTAYIWFSCDSMGQLSKGRDNYNIHFQGAIHLGHSWFLINTIHGGINTDYLKVCYTCSNCEEILEDQLLTNKNKLPPMTLKDNPLLHNKIEDVDPIVADEDASLLQMTKNARSCDAIACILFSRFLRHMNHFRLGVTETSPPSISSVGVAEIIGAGIEKIIRSLSVYLFLYLSRGQLAAEEYLAMIH